MSDNLAESWKQTRQRYGKRNRLTKEGKRVRLFIETPLGRAVAADFLNPLASFLAGELEDKPSPPPNDLGQLVYSLTSEDLAIAVLAPLLDCIYRGWGGQHTRSAEMLLRKQIGRNLHDRLALKKLFELHPEVRRKHSANTEAKKHPWKFVEPDWGPRHCVKAGAWLLEQALALPCFTEPTPEDQFPRISPEWRERIDQAREDLLLRDQVLLPHTKPPPDWVGWKAEYNDRLQANFVRDGHPRTRERITSAFERDDFDHAQGVNALQRVPLRINDRMLPLVERFAVEVMELKRPGRDREADERLVSDDLRVANRLVGQPFYLTYNCDFRGRINPIPHFNYARDDHVRSLFLFENGAPLSTDGLSWLAIHAANCHGATDKEPWSERIKWADNNRKRIQRIADDPISAFLVDDQLGAFQLLRGAEDPFQFVAACFELAGAWKDPTNFETHLPVGFDGSCNGIQHLALLIRDLDAAEKVNVVEPKRAEAGEQKWGPRDVYSLVASTVARLVRTDKSSEWAQWWSAKFDSWDDKKIRKLAKQPVMTFAYSVTRDGMARQVAEAYLEITKNRIEDFRAAVYLATQIREAANEMLLGPANVMTYICSLAAHCAERDLPLEWVSPTRFPVSNIYQKPNETTVYYGSREFVVSEGYLPGIAKVDAVRASAPNFVHSLDASHLIRTVNDAMDTGIPDVITVHDSFACLAPNAQEFGRIIRSQLALMYKYLDPLGRLRAQNYDGDDFPVPAYGELDPMDVQDSEYLFS